MSAIIFTEAHFLTLQQLINNGGTGNFSPVSQDMELSTAWAAMDVLESAGLITFAGAVGTITPEGRDAHQLMSAVYTASF